MNAIVLNATGVYYNVIARPINATEIKKHQHQFTFNFFTLKKDRFIIYKIYKEGEPDIMQGMVAFVQR